ncbi:hypothetical protein P7H19_21555 [Paenibacillus larvae]|nr:hypothetical protein [Paenibacillus larvae]MDT2238340.1 hypothetical protein [Paenibacillus larvae]
MIRDLDGIYIQIKTVEDAIDNASIRKGTGENAAVGDYTVPSFMNSARNVCWQR